MTSTPPLTEFDSASLEKFLIIIAKLLHTEMNYTTINVIKKRVYVNYIRAKLGYHADEQEVKEDIIDYCLSDKAPFYEVFSTFFKNIGFELNRANLLNLFSEFIIKRFYYSFDDMIQAATEDLPTSKSYIALNRMLTNLSEIFKIPITNKDFVVWTLHNTAALYKTEVNSNYILYNRKHTFVLKTKASFPKFYEASYKQIQDYLTLVGITDDAFTDHLYYTLFTHWRNLSTALLKAEQPIKAIIFSNFDIYHAKMVKSQFELSFSGLIDFSVYSSPTVDYASLIDSDYDLIIANFPIPEVTNMEIVTINTLPTQEDVLKVYNAVNNLKK
ncbi:M protein trans-acting positive regulator PRD domain-containing protein [Aerococcus agrisoli]|uniref:M protein trans-acting positive regulator PRD domain-containing protein n=1 Tax=Aerococcus agrisoli TaxID=2487350 RepID=UPI0021054F71|nr:M protein trans-acting positive regulator PRD domain-containing protein [Aerococcus agrisoli]